MSRIVEIIEELESLQKKIESLDVSSDSLITLIKIHTKIQSLELEALKIFNSEQQSDKN